MNSLDHWNWRVSPGQQATPENLTIASAQQFLAQNNIRYVLAQFVDIYGVAKSKAVPVSHFEDILSDGVGFAGGGVFGMRLAPHEAEYMLVGDLSTLKLLPWAPGYARVMGTGTVGGKPHMMDTRNILKAQIDRLGQRGWTLNTGIEPEFSLLERRSDGEVRPLDDTDTLQKPAYDYRGLSRARTFLERVTESLQALDIDVYQIDHEDANGQYEINFKYADALTSADHVTLFKMAAAEIAHELGAICSFMPKPKSSMTGNGMHIHCSIVDEAGKNLFHDASDSSGMGLSKLAYSFTAGILEHAKALTALLAPSVNSYKRLVNGRTASGTTWAPVFVTYGDNNRTAMVRIPYGRIELRVGDSGMNPYLAQAALIAAGLDGVERNLDPGPPQNINFYALTPAAIAASNIDILPQSLSEALDALERSPLFKARLGADFIDEFISLKREEWLDYHRHVSDWETRRYLTFF
ncbi:type III glutamate--ammonia ligase [Hyphomicrobium methylovorum]|uniref:type III glutamate--ammonia ligase n=1 Tax=Hyphomicrobium methylovorum TaxID=84 RepID=UPI0015E7A26A|nr:type III glutamate--ammonia ligase [Hyphomicrobium methylovorum]MBA2124757.1 type III glutamate--ammonia ligase [Hyphomicrobium methylovorum]